MKLIISILLALTLVAAYSFTEVRWGTKDDLVEDENTYLTGDRFVDYDIHGGYLFGDNPVLCVTGVSADAGFAWEPDICRQTAEMYGWKRRTPPRGEQPKPFEFKLYDIANPNVTIDVQGFAAGWTHWRHFPNTQIIYHFDEMYFPPGQPWLPTISWNNLPTFKIVRGGTTYKVQSSRINPFNRMPFDAVLSNNVGWYAWVAPPPIPAPPGPLKGSAFSVYTHRNTRRTWAEFGVCADPFQWAPPPPPAPQVANLEVQGNLSVAGFAHASLIDGTLAWPPCLLGQSSYSYSCVRAIVTMNGTNRAGVAIRPVIREAGLSGSASSSWDKTKKQGRDKTITFLRNRSFYRNLSSMSDSTIYNIDTTDYPLLTVEMTIYPHELDNLYPDSTFFNTWSNDTVNLSAAEVELIAEYPSPDLTSRTGFMRLLISGGQVVESNDRGDFDNILPPIGTTVPLTFLVDTSLFRFDVDATDLIANSQSDSLQLELGNFDESAANVRIGDDYPLPVDLLSFTTRTIENDVELVWSTSQESNNAAFDIERKLTNSNNWLKVGTVEGSGTTNEPRHYIFTDRNVDDGRYNYRLKQIDFNGNFEYFNLANEVVVGVPYKYQLHQNYPNPFNPNTVISFELPEDAAVKLVVYDITGKEVKTLVSEPKTAGYYSVEFNSGKLPSGVYFFKFSADNGMGGAGFVAIKKMMLIK